MARRLRYADLPPSLTIAIGAGGAPQASNAAGNPGGNTTVGSILTAYGGGDTGAVGGVGGGELEPGASGGAIGGGPGGSSALTIWGGGGGGGRAVFGGGGGGGTSVAGVSGVAGAGQARSGGQLERHQRRRQARRGAGMDRMKDHHMRLAQISDGVVVNVIEVDAGAVPEWAADWPLAGDAGPGWLATGVTKREFCLALLDSGIFAIDEVEAIAAGKWPDALAEFLLVLSPHQVASLRIEWSASAVIERTNPVVLTPASYLSLPDRMVDALFGIAPPPETQVTSGQDDPAGDPAPQKIQETRP